MGGIASDGHLVSDMCVMGLGYKDNRVMSISKVRGINSYVIESSYSLGISDLLWTTYPIGKLVSYSDGY